MQTDGRELGDYLMKVLGEREYSFTTSGECKIVRDIKEKLTYVTEDFDTKMTKAETSDLEVETNYELPNGQVIAIGIERFRCLEFLFKPSLTCKESQSIHSLTYDNIIKWIIDMIHIQTQYYQVVQQCFSIDVRLIKEITTLASASIKAKIIAAQTKYRVLISDLSLISLSTFLEMWITRKENTEQQVVISFLQVLQFVFSFLLFVFLFIFSIVSFI